VVYRFTLGERLSASALDLMDSLVEASYASRKEQFLDVSSRRVNTIRFQLRLAVGLRIMPTAAMEQAAKQLEEIGRMIHGWRQSLRGTP
jgi:hypothetical protein